MIEKEILERMEAGVRDYLTRIRPNHAVFVTDDCVKMQVSELKRVFRKSWGVGPREPLTQQAVRELELTVGHFLPKLLERAQAAQLQYSKEQTLWKIRGTAASARIVQAFKEAGLTACVECQRYRAKVFAGIGGRMVRFYIGYKTLEKEDVLPGIIQAVLDLQDALERIGNDVRISR